MATVCTLPVGTTDKIINNCGIYSCPIRYGRLRQQNTRKAPFYAFRGEGGIMRCVWEIEFAGQALVITPSLNLGLVRHQAAQQVSKLFNPSSQHLDKLCKYIQLSYPLGQVGNEDYTQKQYYHFLKKAARQPSQDILPYLENNPQGMAYYDWADFLRGGALYVK